MVKDRFLMGILAGIGVLVVAALVLFFIRQGQSNYGDDSTPAGALQNYFLAIQKRDYQRAYNTLANQPGIPSFSEFEQPFVSYQEAAVAGSAVEIDQVVVDQQNQTATVQVTILNSGRDLFGTSVRSRDTATLVNQNGTWKVLIAPYPYGFPNMPQKAPPSLPSPTPPVATASPTP